MGSTDESWSAQDDNRSMDSRATSELHGDMADPTTKLQKVVPLQSDEGATFSAGWTDTEFDKLLPTRKGTCV